MDRARRRFIQGLAPAAVAAALTGRLGASAFSKSVEWPASPTQSEVPWLPERDAGRDRPPDRMVAPQDSLLKRVATSKPCNGCRAAGSSLATLDLQPVDDSHQQQLFIAHGLVKGVENRAQEVRAQLVEDRQHLFLHLG